MMQTIEVIRQTDPLGQTVWRFWFDDRDATLYLDHYHEAKRETTRHKFKPINYYCRTDRRNNKIEVNDVPLPQDVADEAKAKLMDLITVKKWQR